MAAYMAGTRTIFRICRSFCRNEADKELFLMSNPANDRQAFRDRVATFRIGLWSVERLSPLQCCLHGWKLFQRDILQCIQCKEVIVCRPSTLPHQMDTNLCPNFFIKGKSTTLMLLTDEQFLTSVIKKLTTSHQSGCYWRVNPCPSTFAVIPNLETSDDLNNLTNAISTVAAVNSALPYIDCKSLLNKLDVNSDFLDQICHSESESKYSAALIALTGWEKGIGAYLQCQLCQRRIGFWDFVTRSEYIKIKSNQNINPIHDESNNPGKRKAVMDTPELTTLQKFVKRHGTCEINASAVVNERLTCDDPRKQSLTSGQGNEPSEVDQEDFSQNVDSDTNLCREEVSELNQHNSSATTSENLQAEHNVSEEQLQNVTNPGTDTVIPVLPVLTNEEINDQSFVDSHLILYEIISRVTDFIPEQQEIAVKESTNSQLQSAVNMPSVDVEETVMTSQQKQSEKLLFNVLEEHRYWCPWVCSLGATASPPEPCTGNFTLTQGYQSFVENVKMIVSREERLKEDAQKAKQSANLRQITEAVLGEWFSPICLEN